MQANMTGEKRYNQVFGETFALYTKEEMEEFIEPFRVRFERNNIEPKEIFKGKKCFDAGCGNGRGTLFMLMNGAKHVTCYDFSKKNIETTNKFVYEFGYKNFNAFQGSLENIPIDDEHFDFVWCNGVIMHTKRPNKCLAEIARILRKNGQAWLYIYGAGGVYWRIIYHLREMLKHISIPECMAILKLYRYSTRYIAEFIDDWFSTYVRTYTNEDISRRLMELGFESPVLLKYGMDYDTSHRINVFNTHEEKELMGEGDLRYLLTKRNHAVNHGFEIPEGEYGSDYEWPSSITQELDPLFRKINRVLQKDWAKIAIAAHIQRDLRIVLNKNKKFTLEEITGLIQYLIDQAEQIKDK